MAAEIAALVEVEVRRVLETVYLPMDSPPFTLRSPLLLFSLTYNLSAKCPCSL